jgi:hypothetical protein
VAGSATSGQGITGSSETGIGVVGYSADGPAIIAQGNAFAPGLIALGNYKIDVGGHLEPSTAIAADTNGVLPAAVTNLVQANPGCAALFSGTVFVTDVLNVAGSLNANGGLTATSIGSGVTGQDLSVAGGLSVAGELKTSGTLTASAGVFNGNVTVNGDVSVTGDVILTNSGADCAEQFDLKPMEIADPGTVMIIDDTGALRRSYRSYDRAVAGVVSGAGAYRSAIVLDRQPNSEERTTIAMLGKTYCKVDANAGPIAVGDLLTTSDTPGHAMKVTDPSRGFGAVIGKALAPLDSGIGLVPILIALH